MGINIYEELILLIYHSFNIRNFYKWRYEFSYKLIIFVNCCSVLLTELLHRKDDEIKSACDQKNELFIKLLEIYNMRDLSRVGNSCLPSASHTTDIKLIKNSNKICPALYQVLFFYINIHIENL